MGAFEELLSQDLERRALIKGGLGAAAGLMVGGARRAIAAPPGLPGGLGGADTLTRSLLPTPAALKADFQSMVGFGPRVAGSTHEADFTGWLDEEFTKAGCYRHSAFPEPEKLWWPKKWGLKILEGPEAGVIPVASFRGRSGGFNPDGSPHDAPYEGKLLYLGTAPVPSYSGGALDVLDHAAALQNYAPVFQDWYQAELAAAGEEANGAVVVIDVNGPAPLTMGAIFHAVGGYYGNTPDGLFPGPGAAWVEHRPWKKLWLLSDSSATQSPGTGPVGALYIVDASADALAGQFLPWSGAATELPGLLLDRDTGARVRRAAQAKPMTELTLSASNTDTTTHSWVWKLAGTEEDKLTGGKPDRGDDVAGQVEYVVVNTHADGMSLPEENGGVAMLHIARYFNALKRRGKGPSRTLVFSVVAGHMGASSHPQTEGFIERNPKIVDRTAFGMTLEHIGGSEWVDDTRGFYSTGLPEPAVMYHDRSLTPLLVDSYNSRGFYNHSLANGAGVQFGIGGALSSAVPSVAYIAGPTYLAQIGPDFRKGGWMRQFDPELCARQMEWFLDILTRFESLPFRNGT